MVQRSPLRPSAILYLVLVGGGALLAWYALGRGLSPVRVVFGVSALAAIAVAALERLLPYRRAWWFAQGDVRTDVLHLIFTSLLAAGGRWFNVATMTALGMNRAAAGAALWPAAWPLLAQLALALLLQEFCGYWIHRAQHAVPLLWRFHAVHHSAPRLYWLNQLRNHPVDAMISGLAMAPIAALGAPESTLAVFGVLTTVHLMLQHANIDIRLGPLNWLLSAAEAHRWHHSRVLAESNANYGGVLLIWDALFQTRLLPTDHEPPVSTGLADRDDFPQDYLGQLAAPLRAQLWRSPA